MPGLFSILGATLIGLVVFMSGGKKIIDALPQEHPIKAKYLHRYYGQPQEQTVADQ